MSQTEKRAGASEPSGQTGGSSGAGKQASVGPQRLQTAIRITTPASWVIGAVFAFLTVAVIVWGVLGQLSTRVGGLGMVMSEEGDILIARSLIAGTVTEMAAAEGDDVAKGDVLARVGQPGQEAEITAAKQRVELLQQQYQRREQQVQKDLAERQAEVERKREVLSQRKGALRERISYLNDLLATLKDELEQRLVTADKVQDVRERLAEAKVQLNEIDVQLSQARLEYLEFEDEREASLAELDRTLTEAKAKLNTLQATRQEETVVRAQETGRVIEVAANRGDVVEPGAAIARIDAKGGSLRVIGFFEAADGKKVSAGMDASVAPSTAERSIWGTIEGKVRHVSELPATIASVTNTLGSREMAEQVFDSGPPIVVQIELSKNPNTPSGLEWSSGQGPPYEITHGTMSAVSVVVRKEAPANLVIPVFRRWVGHGS